MFLRILWCGVLIEAACGGGEGENRGDEFKLVFAKVRSISRQIPVTMNSILVVALMAAPKRPAPIATPSSSSDCE